MKNRLVFTDLFCDLSDFGPDGKSSVIIARFQMSSSHFFSRVNVIQTCLWSQICCSLVKRNGLSGLFILDLIIQNAYNMLNITGYFIKLTRKSASSKQRPDALTVSLFSVSNRIA